MPIKKIPYTNSEQDDKYLNISEAEIIKWHAKILDSYDKYLKSYGAKDALIKLGEH